MITFTEEAIAKLIEASKDNGYENNTHVRIKVVGGGCAGFMYDMSFMDDEEKIKINKSLEDVININGIFNVVVDNISSQYIDDTIVGWFSSPSGEGFKFDNPNSTSCGCGKSFSTV
jgi:iron-sulfur cluster assembly accessory protein